MDKNFSKNKIIFDKIKWILAMVVLFFSIFLNVCFEDLNFFIRFILFIVCFILSVGIVFFTLKGKKFLVFLRDSYFELKKVIWPTREESLQTTLIVFIVTTFMALVLWGLDTIIINLISFVTNLRF